MTEKYRMLIIDDEESILSPLDEYFTLKNYEVSVVRDGHDAMKLLGRENGTFDLVITDLKMKSVSGIAVTQWIKKFHPDIPVVILTGYLSQYESLAREAKPDLLVEKPMDVSKLEKMIRNLLTQRGPDGDAGSRIKA